MTLRISHLKPFAQGGNRLCFIHPDDPQKCIKVRRPDFTLVDLRRKKGFPKNLRPLSSFDDNLEEYQVMTRLHQRYGQSLYQHVSQCYGFIETDMGKGLVSELIRDDDLRISHSLKQFLWDHGYTNACREAIVEFEAYWQSQAIPSRDLLLHNIVVQTQSQTIIKRLVVIDGLGNPNVVPDWVMPYAVRARRAQRKIKNLHQRIDDLLGLRGQDQFPGYHGQLLHDGIDELSPNMEPGSTK